MLLIDEIRETILIWILIRQIYYELIQVKWLCNTTTQVESVKRYNLQDFTYVAKDKYWTAHSYKCYVLDMRIHWQTIANTWHDMCRNWMIECELSNIAAELSNNGFF